jgi:predicted nucleotidyltransferase
MIGKNIKWKILSYFFTVPNKSIHLRELSRQTGVSMPTIVTTTNTLEQEGLLHIDRQRAWTMVKASGNERFRRLKRVHNLQQLYESGIVDALIKASNHPQAIICFGSYSRGEDDEKSDIDIAILNGRSGKISEMFDKVLRRPVSLHYPKMERISNEFREELRNGIILDGAW